MSAPRICFTALTIAAGIALAGPPALAQSGPFSGLAGTWNGTGQIALASGARERIRCRATYAVGSGGNALQQNLRCASDSYNFDLGSNVTHSGGNISGTWSETSRNVGGNVTGQVRGDQIVARVDSPVFTATLQLVTRGNRQSVTISSESTELSGVSITLTRGR